MQKEHTKTNIDCYELDYVQRILDKKIKGISQEQEQDTRWIATQAQEEYKITCKE